MNDTERAILLSFAAAFVVVVAAGAVLGFVVGDDTSDGLPGYTDIDNPQYDADRVSSDPSPGEADVDVDTHVSGNEVVVHVGGQVAERDVAPLVNAIVESGNQVTIVADGFDEPDEGPVMVGQSAVRQVTPPDDGGNSALADELDDAHGFVSVGVTSYSEAEVADITDFFEDDGRVVVAVDPAEEFALGDGLSETFAELGVYTQPGYVYNLDENDLNYQRIFAEPEDSTMLTHGVERAVFDTATPVQAAGVDEAMVPIEGSELSVSREETDEPVLVRDGDVALVGDTGFMTPENTQRADNDVLVANVAEFLLEADRVLDGDTGIDGPGDGAPSISVAVGPDDEPGFSPDIVEIEPGTTVVFEWESDGHNLVPVSQPAGAEWDGVETVRDEGFVHEHSFQTEGVYEFVSGPHENEGMFGMIVVDGS